jgi:transcription antitermination factor NusG
MCYVSVGDFAVGGFWSVVQTAPCQERRARDHLRRAGREVFLPMIEQRVRINRTTRIREYPLFPSYIFVRMCAAVTSILGTIGVLRILSNGCTPSCLPDEFVDKLAVTLDDEGVVRLPKRVPTRSRFSRGQRVFARAGPFELLPGVFDGMSGAERCRVLYDVLGNETTVVVDAGLLRTG